MPPFSELKLYPSMINSPTTLLCWPILFHDDLHANYVPPDDQDCDDDTRVDAGASVVSQHGDLGGHDGPTIFVLPMIPADTYGHKARMKVDVDEGGMEANLDPDIDGNNVGVNARVM